MNITKIPFLLTCHTPFPVDMKSAIGAQFGRVKLFSPHPPRTERVACLEAMVSGRG